MDEEFEKIGTVNTQELIDRFRDVPKDVLDRLIAEQRVSFWEGMEGAGGATGDAFHGRVGDWMQTFTGRQFWPLDPRDDEIDIEDIAHSLAHQCRYAGHVSLFYSVAEHCVLLSYAVPYEFRLEALMHDAAEAYLVDVPRPVKASMPEYKVAEKRLERVIAEKYMLEYPWPFIVMFRDARILMDERNQLMSPPPVPWGNEMEPLGVRVRGWSPKKAKKRFLRRFDELMGEAG